MSYVKRWMLSGLLMWAGMSQGQDPEVEYAHQHTPNYPQSLYDGGASGVVIVEMVGHHDGSISDVQVIDSSHAPLATSVKRAISMSRLKPWLTSAELADAVSIKQAFYFVHTKEAGDDHGWVVRHVRRLSCSNFNKALSVFRAHWPDRAPTDMHVFTYTFKVLARSATLHKLPDEQRELLGDDLVQAIPGVIRTCNASPDSRYRDALPEGVRRML